MARPPSVPFLRRGQSPSADPLASTADGHRYLRRRGPNEVELERRQRLRASRETAERDAIAQRVAERATLHGGGSPVRRRDAKWTEDACLAALRAFQASKGRSPRIADLERERRLPSRSTVVRLFGSFNAGLVAAGLPLNHVATGKKGWSDEQILDAIRRAELEGEPTSKPFRTGRRKPWIGTIERRFGSWRAARALALRHGSPSGSPHP